LLDARRAIDENIVKLFFELAHQLSHLSGRDRALVPGLSGGKQVEPLRTLVANERLLEAAFTFYYVN
jgi:hypothetical protein